MDDYTPTTEEVRRQWNNAVRSDLVAARSADFNRWLASVRADAWDEGAQWAAVELGAIKRVENQWVAPTDNPYRSEKRDTLS